MGAPWIQENVIKCRICLTPWQRSHCYTYQQEASSGNGRDAAFCESCGLIMFQNGFKQRALGITFVLLAAIAACTGAERGPVSGGEYSGSVNVNGQNHNYRLYVPRAGVEAGQSLALVVSLHGGGGTLDTFAAFTRMRANADVNGYAILEAEGFNGTWNAGSCCAPAMSSDIDHVRVIERMVEAANEIAPINRRRIYAAGHSNGGMLAYRLACQASDWVAAIAAVSAFMMDKDYDQNPPQTVYACEPTRAVPILHIHGLADTCAPFEGGISTGPAGGQRPAVRDNLDFWAQNNACLSAPTGPYFENGDAQCEQYSGCLSGAPVELCTIEGGGHIWPGTGANPTGVTCGGEGSTALNANERIWAFFSGHTL